MTDTPQDLAAPVLTDEQHDLAASIAWVESFVHLPVRDKILRSLARYEAQAGELDRYREALGKIERQETVPGGAGVIRGNAALMDCGEHIRHNPHAKRCRRCTAVKVAREALAVEEPAADNFEANYEPGEFLPLREATEQATRGLPRDDSRVGGVVAPAALAPAERAVVHFAERALAFALRALALLCAASHCRPEVAAASLECRCLVSHRRAPFVGVYLYESRERGFVTVEDESDDGSCGDCTAKIDPEWYEACPACGAVCGHDYCAPCPSVEGGVSGT